METGYVLDSITKAPFATIKTERRVREITVAHGGIAGSTGVNQKRHSVSYAKKWESYEMKANTILEPLGQHTFSNGAVMFFPYPAR